LSRSVTESSNSDSAINLSGNAVVFVTPRATDLPFTDGAVFTAPITVGNGSTSAGSVKFLEDSDNGTNGITLIGPASTGDVTFTLPSADGSANTFLKTDGSGTLSFAAAGADPDLYRDNSVSGVTPTASGNNTVAIGNSASASGSKGLAVGSDTTSAGTGASAIGFGSSANGASALALQGGDADGDAALAIGKGSTSYQAKAQANGAVAIGASYADGVDSFAVNIANNTNSYGATGANSIAIGRLAKTTGTDGTSVGAANNNQGNYSAAFGRGNTVTSGSEFSIAVGAATYVAGDRTVAIGASANAQHDSSVAIGDLCKTKAKGHVVFGGVGDASHDGRFQSGIFILRTSTTNATATVMTSDAGSASTNNQVVLANSEVMAFTGTIVAREDKDDGHDYAGWEVKGVINRETNAGTTYLGAGIVNTLYYTSNLQNASVALSADTTNGALKVEVTGIGSTNLRWQASLYTTELTNV
jgi:hypothetical protein